LRGGCARAHQGCRVATRRGRAATRRVSDCADR
jgi:hypothetical protein